MNVVEPYDDRDMMVSLSFLYKYNVAQHLQRNVSELAIQLHRIKSQNSKIFSEIKVGKHPHIILVNNNIINQTTEVSNHHIGKIMFSLPSIEKT